MTMTNTNNQITTYQDQYYFGYAQSENPTIIYTDNDDAADFWEEAEYVGLGHRIYNGNDYLLSNITFYNTPAATICVINGQWYEIDGDKIMTEIDTPSDINTWFNRKIGV